MNPHLLNYITISDLVVILQARTDLSYNLLIRSAAYKIINHTTVIPAQNLKDVIQEITVVKKIKIPNEIPSASWMKSNSSSVLYITSKLRQLARSVAVNKEKRERS